MAKKLVVVESPAKARTIKKYLGPEFEVLASYGHVRDLRPRDGAVEPESGFRMHYQLIEKNAKHVEALRRAMRKAEALYLATDPDREGEAISWHVCELLAEAGVLDGKPVYRVVFHEITRRAIEEAVAHPRQISMPLVNAQQARRALDYLVGFNLSPLLWKKIRRGLSAGRVQSPALRLICEREEEIERFERREYWTIESDLAHGGAPFSARLTHHRGAKLEQFSIGAEEQARAVVGELERAAGAQLTVEKVEKKQRKRQPAAPFITSTLQQEAARKLGFSAQRTMRVAQQLYEGVDTGSGRVGLITYMRTDSVTLAGEALAELREFIAERFGAEELPARARTYKTRARNAQEAHEAIRPTSVRRTPEALERHLDRDQARLYRLVWQRTVACQMRPALIDTVAVDLACGREQPPVGRFRATGSTIAEPGFLRVYEEGRDEEPAAEEGRRLPALKRGDRVELLAIRPEQHFTEPPPRYSEATLIRTLEEYGIGRPSTYASIIQTLIQREYAELEKRRFRPTDIGRLVNRFLTEHFGDYVDYEFTARLEDDLDAVARGEREWVPLMEAFWEPLRDKVRDKESSVSRGEAARARVLGSDPASGREVSVRMGRYGPYVQIGTREDEDKPRFAGLRPDQRMDCITLEEALELFRLPRELGETPEGEPVSVGIGRYGPYVKYGKRYVSLGREDDPHTITLERALELIAEKKIADASRVIRDFEDQGIRVLRGRFGPYVTDGKRNARVPKGTEPEGLSLGQARELLAAAPARTARRRRRSSNSG